MTNMMRVRLDEIELGTRLRSILNEDAVTGICESIKEIGLQTPIAIYLAEDGQTPVLTAGRHRLEAMKRCGIEYAECTVFPDRLAARKWEISENLHRAELDALERDEHVAEWIAILGQSSHGDVLRQVDAKGGRPKGGVRAAARDLGLSEPDARRAVKVAALSDEAKQAARELGLANNRSALLAAASLSETGQQVHSLRSWGQDKQRGPEISGAKADAFWKIWNRLDDDVKEEIRNVFHNVDDEVITFLARYASDALIEGLSPESLQVRARSEMAVILQAYSKLKAAAS